MVSIIPCHARVFRSLSRTCSLQLALPVPFYIFSVLQVLVNTTSLLMNPTSFAFMTASTMTSWPAKGVEYAFKLLQPSKSLTPAAFFASKEYTLLLYFSCSWFLLSWWGVAFHCHFLIVSFAAFPERVIISYFIFEWKNAWIQCRVSAYLTLLSEVELKLQGFCDKEFGQCLLHTCVLHTTWGSHM